MPAPQTWEEACKQTWDKVKQVALEARKGHECVEPCYEELWVRIRKETDKDSVTADVCYGLSDQEGVDEASFKPPEATSFLQALILTGDFKCPDVCSSRNKHGGEQAIQSECPGDVFFARGARQPN